MIVLRVRARCKCLGLIFVYLGSQCTCFGPDLQSSILGPDKLFSGPLLGPIYNPRAKQFCIQSRPETDWVLPESDQDRKSKLSFRFRFTGTGFSENKIPFRPDRISKFNRILARFQNSARFLPDFQIPPDSYRNPKYCRKIT